MISPQKVSEFWKWFADNAPYFGAAFDNSALLEELDAKVISLGDFAWEVGPGKKAANSFVLSPGGDREMLRETRAIVAAAPIIPDWELHFAKPCKQWKPQFELPGVDGTSFVVDATAWRCVLLRYPDGMLEIVVEAPDLEPLTEDYRRWAAEIVLDGFLGEQCRIECIDRVTVALRLERAERDAAFPVAEICAHFNGTISVD